MSVSESTAVRGATGHTASSVDARDDRSRGRSSARARGREATRARLLESGRRLFAQHGLHGVTTHDIAHAAEVASGTFYLHFKDKAALLRVIADDTIALLRERLDSATRSARGAREGVPAFSEALITFAEENRDLVRILFSRDSEAAAVEADVLNQLAASITGGRRQRIASGEMPSHLHPEVLAQALVGLLARVVAWWVENPERASRQSVVETLTRIQLEGTHPPRPT
jgi:AcrR family transcriptional regulator